MTENNDALNWLKRSCGKWRSERRYLFSDAGKSVCYTTHMVISSGDSDNEFTIEWTGKTQGKMEVALNGNRLERSRDYFGDEAHDSEVEMVDKDTICFNTSYGGLSYREEIRLLCQDRYRLRQTFATKDDGSFGIAGQYCEFRELV